MTIYYRLTAEQRSQQGQYCQWGKAESGWYIDLLASETSYSSVIS